LAKFLASVAHASKTYDAYYDMCHHISTAGVACVMTFNRIIIYLNAGHPEGCLDVRGHSERDALWHTQALALLKADVVVDVHHLIKTI
jgi:hypothetical protein